MGFKGIFSCIKTLEGGRLTVDIPTQTHCVLSKKSLELNLRNIIFFVTFDTVKFPEIAVFLLAINICFKFLVSLINFTRINWHYIVNCLIV